MKNDRVIIRGLGISKAIKAVKNVVTTIPIFYSRQSDPAIYLASGASNHATATDIIIDGGVSLMTLSAVEGR